MANFHELTVREWEDVSYYVNSTKKWTYGTVAISIQYVYFESHDQSIVLKVNMNDIINVRKTVTGLIYGAVVISTASEQHWFSSIPREDAFNTIYYIHRSTLLKPSASMSPKTRNNSGSSTVMGQKLLTVALDSER